MTQMEQAELIAREQDKTYPSTAIGTVAGPIWQRRALLAIIDGLRDDLAQSEARWGDEKLMRCKLEEVLREGRDGAIKADDPDWWGKVSDLLDPVDDNPDGEVPGA